MLKSGKLFITVILIGFFFSSCVPVRRLAYVQSDRRVDPSEMNYIGEPVDARIRPGDEIYIRINSADDDAVDYTADWQRGIHDPTLLSYTVADDGTVKLPYIGRIVLVELTLEEASDKIEEALSQYLFLPSVYMRFVNTKVTVLGEVNSPGVYVFNYKSINIFQAIGYANDISEFGNRRNVLLIREEGVKRSKHYIDLTRDDLLESEFYTLKSEDIIYVEPLKRKKWGMTTIPYNLILTVVTTGLFVYNVLILD